MIKISDIRDHFEKCVPSSLKKDYDNVGLLAGEAGQRVGRVLVSLDITEDVIDEAHQLGAELIVAHHPIIFSPVKSVSDTDLTGKKLVSLIKKGIGAICLHTNLDVVDGGVNDALIKILGGETAEILDDKTRLGRIADLPNPISVSEFLEKTKNALNANGLRYHDAGKPVKRIGCCGGSGGEFLETAVHKGCDTYVTADVKYNVFLDAKELGITLIDADHFCTENVVIPVLADILKESFPQLEVFISQCHVQTAKFY